MKEVSPPGQAVEGLARSLLQESIPDDDAPGERCAYPWVDMLLVSLFVAFHATLLVIYNTPATGLNRVLYAWLNTYAEMSGYMGTVGNTPSWGMFAPNPPRANIFLKVLVEDQSGTTWDLRHDFYGHRRYPYLFYERLRKVNERLIEEPKYRPYYAAWVCRDWERAHAGHPARGVRFIRLWTRIPPPEQTYLSMGYHPMLLELHEVPEDAVTCAAIPHGQLPDSLRKRYGIPPAPEGTFRDIQTRTWWDQR